MAILLGEGWDMLESVEYPWHQAEENIAAGQMDEAAVSWRGSGIEPATAQGITRRVQKGRFQPGFPRTQAGIQYNRPEPFSIFFNQIFPPFGGRGSNFLRC